MHGFLLLADAARAHPDGTFSLLRGGITRLHSARNEAIRFRGSLVARLHGEAGDEGDHPFEIRLMNDHGDDIMPRLSGSIPINRGGSDGQVVADIQVPIPGYGSYKFVLRVDNQVMAEWALEAVERAPETGGA